MPCSTGLYVFVTRQDTLLVKCRYNAYNVAVPDTDVMHNVSHNVADHSDIRYSNRQAPILTH